MEVMGRDCGYLALMAGIAGGGGALTAEWPTARLPGAIRVHVNLLTEMSCVEIDPTTVSEEQVVATVAGLGLRPSRSSMRQRSLAMLRSSSGRLPRTSPGSVRTLAVKHRLRR